LQELSIAKEKRFLFHSKPLRIYWELTQACDLACKHCRAEANPNRHPNELTTEEIKKVIDDIKGFGKPFPHLIMTGGDLLYREDIFEIVEYAILQGFGVSISPSGTNKLSYEKLLKFKKIGVSAMSLSIDGSNKKRHDEFRGVDGVFDITIQAIRWVREIRIPLQINTLVSLETYEDIPNVYELLKKEGTDRWSLFFLVQVGRGEVLQQISPFQAHKLMTWLFEMSRISKFVITTTEAPHYRYVIYENLKKIGREEKSIIKSPIGRGFGIRDGNGILFISHTGDIYPSGFLEISVRNSRVGNIVDIYRNNEIFRNLREPSLLKGRCGICEYKYICGGSRARAYADTNDYLMEDKLCDYEPKGDVL
jgi:radical SAM protein